MDGGFPVDFHYKPPPWAADVVAAVVAGLFCSIHSVGILLVGGVEKDKRNKAAVNSCHEGPGCRGLGCYNVWLTFLCSSVAA